MFKKLFLSVLAIIVVMANGTVALAAEITEASSNGFYVVSGYVPQDAIDYAASNAFDFLISRSDVDNIEVNELKMGSPFTFGSKDVVEGDVFYFPIYENQKVNYTFRVYREQGSYTGILSPYMADELNHYTNKTSESTPLSIYMENGNTIASIGETTEIMEEAHYGYHPTAKKSANVSLYGDSIHTIDITNTISFESSSSPIPSALRVVLQSCLLFLRILKFQ